MSATTIQPYRSNYLMPALEHATVGDAMHAGIVTCQAETPLTRVAQLMARHRVHCVAVMGAFADDPGQLRVWGIVTDLELARAGIRTRIDRTAGSLALAPVVFCEPATPLREAGELMVTRGITHLVVVEPMTGRPVGVLSTLDIAAVLAGSQP